MPIRRVQRGDSVYPFLSDERNQIADAVDRYQEAQQYSTTSNHLHRVYAPVGGIPTLGFGSIVNPIPHPATDDSRFVTMAELSLAVPKVNEDLTGTLMQPTTNLPEGVGGFAQPDGIIRCRINITDIQHQYAIPITGEVRRLQSAGMGYRIIWKEDAGTASEQWCLVRLSHWGYTVVTGITDGIVPVGGSNTITVDGGMVGDGSPYTVWDYFGEEIGSGVKVWAMHTRPDKAMIFAAECETDGGGIGPTFPT